MTKVIKLKTKFYYLSVVIYTLLIATLFFILPRVIKLYPDTVPIWVVVVSIISLSFIARQRKHFGRILAIKEGQLICLSRLNGKVRWSESIQDIQRVDKHKGNLLIYAKRKKYTFSNVARLKSTVLELKKALNLSSD